MNVNDKRPVAFITGASRGIGRGIAIELASHGYDIAGSSRVLDSQNRESGIFEVKQRVEEEVEAVRDVLGASVALAGFYSYGEISPFTPGAKCELHNQTMTITALSEQ